MIINKTIYFVHIPRTGGVYIQDLFRNNKHEISSGSFTQHFRGKEIPHLTYPEYEFYLNFMKCKKFTVVRDPVERFISAVSNDMLINPETFDKILKDQESLDIYLNNMVYNDFANWYVPQINFLNHSIKIYRYEDGLGLEFNKWLKDNFNLKIVDYTSKDSYASKYKYELSERQKDYVKNFYYKDYKILDY